MLARMRARQAQKLSGEKEPLVDTTLSSSNIVNSNSTPTSCASGATPTATAAGARLHPVVTSACAPV